MIGLDLLGLGSPAWKIKETVASWPQGYAVGCFDNSWPNAFGDPRQNLAAIIATGKCPAVLVQGWWSYQHKIVPLDICKAVALKWQKFALAHPGPRYFLSHSCEYAENSAAEVLKRVQIVQKYAPALTPVNTPMRSPAPGGALVELHGRVNCGPGQIASYDGGFKGEGIYDWDADAWVRQNSDAVMCRLWAPRFNGAESGEMPTPNKRTAFPDGRFIRAVARLGMPEGTAPAPHFDAIPFAAPMLYKSFAEDMPGAQPRDNMPLIIVRGSAKAAEVVTFDGSVIGRFPRFGHPGEYPGNLTRYYSGLSGGMNLYGAEIAQKALAQSGSEFVWFHVDNKFYGPVSAAFRRGFFR